MPCGVRSSGAPGGRRRAQAARAWRAGPPRAVASLRRCARSRRAAGRRRTSPRSRPSPGRRRSRA
ncbi:MAG: hypothetical protein E6G31_05105 [Actinobacteria bacterium]|nr:MAG: hypothetical protein E6G31_05105 [Actinomycetota bacterium]